MNGNNVSVKGEKKMDQILLPRLSIEITTRCNLKCKYCSVGIPTQKEILHLDLKTVRELLEKIFEVVDYVESLEFTGGEPLLHEQLPEMIRAYMQYKQYFGRFLIVTNGTVPIHQELLSVLEEYQGYGIIHISDYGLSPARTKELVETLEKIGFPYRVDKYWGDDQYQGGWVDPGEVVSHSRTPEQLADVFSGCGLVVNGGCWRVHKGQMHICARSCRCADAGYVFTEDFVDLLENTSVEAKRAKLRELRRKIFLRACDYCNGDMGTTDPAKRIPAGVQVLKAEEK